MHPASTNIPGNRALCTPSSGAIADFIAVIEGATFDRFAGARADLPAGIPESAAQLAGVLGAYLRGMLRG